AETLERRSDSIRADMGETLSELERTLSPSALVDRSMNLLRNHGGDMATKLLETVRRNPGPALLMAAGAAWMVSAQMRSSRGDAENEVSEPGKMASAAHAASDAVGEGLQTVKERARSAVESARETSRHTGEGMARLLREQPLAVGVAGILTGALIGALLPETAQEDRLLGAARQTAMDKARAAGEQTFESAKEKVNDVVERTTESLRGGESSPPA
ncbi:MAG: DUF3618 domain-containing protein, partial [Rhizobiaceae bacterium]